MHNTLIQLIIYEPNFIGRISYLKEKLSHIKKNKMALSAISSNFDKEYENYLLRLIIENYNDQKLLNIINEDIIQGFLKRTDMNTYHFANAYQSSTFYLKLFCMKRDHISNPNLININLKFLSSLIKYTKMSLLEAIESPCLVIDLVVGYSSLLEKGFLTRVKQTIKKQENFIEYVKKMIGKIVYLMYQCIIICEESSLLKRNVLEEFDSVKHCICYLITEGIIQFPHIQSYLPTYICDDVEFLLQQKKPKEIHQFILNKRETNITKSKDQNSSQKSWIQILTLEKTIKETDSQNKSDIQNISSSSESYVEEQKIIPSKSPKKKQIKTMQNNVIFTGKNQEGKEIWIKKFSKKKLSNILTYIEDLSGFIQVLEDPEKQAEYFYSESEFITFRSTYLFNLIKYFIENVKEIKSNLAFQSLCISIMRLVDYFSKNQIKQLQDQLFKEISKLDPYEINITLLRDSVLEALDGNYVDYSFQFSEIKYDYDSNCEPIKYETNADMILDFLDIYQENFKSNELQKISEWRKELKDQFDMWKLPNNQPMSEILINYLKDLIDGLSKYKELKACEILVDSIGNCKIPDFGMNEVKPFLESIRKKIRSLENIAHFDEFKVFYQISDIELNIVKNERILDISSTANDIEKYLETETKRIHRSYAAMNLFSKALYEKKKPIREDYKSLNFCSTR